MKEPPILCDKTFNKNVPDTREWQSFRRPNPVLSPLPPPPSICLFLRTDSFISPPPAIRSLDINIP